MSKVDDNLRAINDFFHRPENAPKTPAAKVVFNEWVTWWEANGGNWFNGQAEFDHARRKWWFWPSMAAGATALAIVAVPKALKLWLGVR